MSILIDPTKILSEAELFFRFRTDKNLIHQEEVIIRTERYLHALELIKELSFHSKKARDIHKKKFELSHETIRTDFLIAWHILGKDGNYNKESIRNFMIHKLLKWIEIAEEKGDLDALDKLTKRLYEYRDLDKDTSDLPDFSTFAFPAPEITINEKALEFKLNPKLLEDKINKWHTPKNKKETVLEEAKIVDENEQSS